MIKDTSKKLPLVDHGKVAAALGAERRGHVRAGSGYFAAARLAAVVSETRCTTSESAPVTVERDARCASRGKPTAPDRPTS